MRYGFMKKGLSSLLIFGLALSIASCGKKQNEVNSDDDNNSNTTFLNQGHRRLQLLSNLVCRGSLEILLCNNYPNRRLSQTYTFSTNNYNFGSSRTSIYGPFQQTPIHGNVSQIFVGLSTFGDVMIVSKVGNGSQVQGYNIQLSMCAEWNRQTNVPYIDDSRPVTNFQANQIVLDVDNNCGYGSVDAALNTIVSTGPYNGNNGGFSFSLPAYNAYTTFYKPSCNGTN